MIRDMNRASRVQDYIFQQDGAHAHTAAATLENLDKRVPEYLGPDFWPPNSPNFSPCDYSIWIIFKDR